jgi:hypothetical protein
VINIVEDVESPHSSEKIEKKARPTMNTRLRPSKSPKRPPSRSSPPKVKA